MASSAAAKIPPCATCKKTAGIFICGGCNQAFCTKHTNEHRQILGKEMDEIVLEHDQLRQSLIEQIDGMDQCSSLRDIEDWEKKSVHKIRRIAETARQKLKEYLTERNQYIQIAVQKLKEELSKARIEDDFVETDLKGWFDQINELRSNISTSIPVFFENFDDDLIRFVTHPHPQDDSNPRVIALPKSTERLGLSIKGGREWNSPIYIYNIVPDSVAWQYGLQEGDQLLFVNGVSVENGDHEKAVDLIKQAQGSVKLVVRHSPNGFGRSE